MSVATLGPTLLQDPRSREPAASEHLAHLAARLLGTKVVATPLAHGLKIPDAKETWILKDESGSPWAAAQLSGTRAPAMVARGVASADTIRSALRLPESERILPALASGDIGGRSYAIWRFCRQPSLPQRGLPWLARRAFLQPTLEWLREVVLQTVHAVPAHAIADRVDGPLRSMATDPGLSCRMRLCARDALVRLDRGRWQPMHVAMHGDLQRNKLLIDGDDQGAAEPGDDGFVIVDWCGASLDGWPVLDLIRIADSLRAPTALLAAELAVHCALLGGDLEDAGAHVAAALAHLGAHRECFPFAVYAALGDRMLARLEAAMVLAGVAS